MLMTPQELEQQFKETSYSNPYGSRLLSYIMSNQFEQVHLLLKDGLNPDAADRDGNTILCKALEYGQDEMVWLLLGYKANPNKHGQGRTSALMRSQNPQTTAFLLKAGAQLYTPAETEEHFYLPSIDSLDSLKLIVTAGFDINTKGPNGQTLLHRAVACNNKEAIDYILEKGADKQAQTDIGLNAADFAQTPTVSSEIKSYIQELGITPIQKPQKTEQTSIPQPQKPSVLRAFFFMSAIAVLALHQAASQTEETTQQQVNILPKKHETIAHKKEPLFLFFHTKTTRQNSF